MYGLFLVGLGVRETIHSARLPAEQASKIGTLQSVSRNNQKHAQTRQHSPVRVLASEHTTTDTPIGE